ncbi:MAG: pilin [Defluviitaleaceae bacterium]|nr:pilin [Defluviitaleaceae bacterium]
MFDFLPALLAAGTGPDLTQVTAPITDLLLTVFNVAIPVVGALGAIFCIFLGVKLAKADEQQDREKAKTALKNAIIGFALIFILVVALRIGIDIMADWANEVSASALI